MPLAGGDVRARRGPAERACRRGIRPRDWYHQTHVVLGHLPRTASCDGATLLTSSASVVDDLPSCADVETDVIRIQLNRFEKADGVAEADFDLRRIREEFAHDEERICSSVLYFHDALLGGVGYGIYRTEDDGFAIRVAR